MIEPDEQLPRYVLRRGRLDGRWQVRRRYEIAPGIADEKLISTHEWAVDAIAECERLTLKDEGGKQ